MLDEFEAAGTQRSRRATALQETIDVMRAVWVGGPVTYRGATVTLDESHIGPPPTGSIALMLGGGWGNPKAAERIAAHADGWLGANLNGENTMAISKHLDELARAAGRGHLEVINRANITLTDTPLDDDRPPWHGTFDQIVADIRDNAEAGVEELILDLQLQPGFRGTEWTLEIALELKTAVE